MHRKRRQEPIECIQKGTSCPNCEGILDERSIYDDWDGCLTCDSCGQRFSTRKT